MKGELSTFSAKSEMLEDFRTELTASREQNEKNLKLITELRDENNQKTNLLDQSAIFFKKKEDAIAELSEKVKNLEHEKQQIEREMNEKVSALSNNLADFEKLKEEKEKLECSLAETEKLISEQSELKEKIKELTENIGKTRKIFLKIRINIYFFN